MANAQIIPKMLHPHGPRRFTNMNGVGPCDQEENREDL
jgi:hypothetical protein